MEELGDKESGNFVEAHSKINVQRRSIRKSIFDIKWIQTLSETIRAQNGDRDDFENVIIVTEALFWIIKENEGKMFETQIQCALLNQEQIRNNVPVSSDCM